MQHKMIVTLFLILIATGCGGTPSAANTSEKKTVGISIDGITPDEGSGGAPTEKQTGSKGAKVSFAAARSERSQYISNITAAVSTECFACDLALQDLEDVNKKLTLAEEQILNPPTEVIGESAVRNNVSSTGSYNTLKGRLEECMKKCRESTKVLVSSGNAGSEEIIAAPATSLGPCERYSSLLAKYGISVTNYPNMTVETLANMGVTESARGAIENEKSACGSGVKKLEASGVSAAGGSTTKQSCDQICQARGMTHQKIDWTSQIVDYADANAVCAASFTIDWGKNSLTQGCTCRPVTMPKITVTSERYVCNSVCGAVACGSTARCDVDGTTTSVECKWRGWEALSDGRFVPKGSIA